MGLNNTEVPLAVRETIYRIEEKAKALDEAVQKGARLRAVLDKYDLLMEAEYIRGRWKMPCEHAFARRIIQTR